MTDTLTPEQVDEIQWHFTRAIRSGRKIQVSEWMFDTLITSHRALGKMADEQTAVNYELRAKNEVLKKIIASLVPAPIVDSGGRNIE